MSDILIISDDLRRTKLLVLEIGKFDVSYIHDLYEDLDPSGQPAIIISDVKHMTADALQRMRDLLGRVRNGHSPYLCLLHDRSSRTLAYVDLLGASSLIDATFGFDALVNALAELTVQAAPIPAITQRHAETAQQFLRETFVPSRQITPERIDDGTAIIASAVAEAGIRSWVQAVRRFDDATHQHCLLVAGLCAAFGGTLTLRAHDHHDLVKAALVHDVGKMCIPPAILNKPGKLDPAEMAVMRTHAARGHEMLMGCGFDDRLLAVVRSHHEMLDGSGYPDGLSGRQIPDLVRLVTICDIFGALIERRPYRAPMSTTKAYGILVEMGERLDVDLVRVFRPVAEAFGP